MDELDDFLVVKNTEKGRSVFAKDLFRQGDIVAEYKGQFVPFDDFKNRSKEADFSGNCFFFEFFFNDRKCAIDAGDENETKGRLINHSKRHPNVKPIVHTNAKGKPVILFKALKKIDTDQEILYDYFERRSSVIQMYPWLKE